MAAAGALDDATWLDRALYDWELARDRECVISYHFALRLSKTHPVSPVELEIWRSSEHDPERARRLGDAFGRTLSAEKFLNWPDLITWTSRALLDSRQPKRNVADDVIREVTTKARLYRDLARIARRQRPLARNWDAWGGAKPIPPEQAAKAKGYVAPRQPQRSDLLGEEGEISRNGKAAAPVTLEAAS
jgi:hypothetical protein